MKHLHCPGCCGHSSKPDTGQLIIQWEDRSRTRKSQAFRVAPENKTVFFPHPRQSLPGLLVSCLWIDPSLQWLRAEASFPSKNRSPIPTIGMWDSPKAWQDNPLRVWLGGCHEKSSHNCGWAPISHPMPYSSPVQPALSYPGVPKS